MWGLAKNFKVHEAQQIASGNLPSTPRVRSLRPDDLRRKAERSLKRAQARRQNATNNSHTNDHDPQSSRSPEATQSSRQALLIVAPHRPQLSQIESPLRIKPSTKSFELLFQKLRLYTHQACVEGRHWDPESSHKNAVGRMALRELSLDLTAGVKSHEERNHQRANKLWSRALDKASKPDLLDTWYYETPINILFELGRLVHKGHDAVADMLMKTVTSYAKKILDKKDPRYSLFAVFDSLETTQLENGYSSAALSLLEGLATRLEKHNPLFYQFGLNRALDLVWFDPKTDLRKWVVPVEEIDRHLGPDSDLSIYFLLLDTYRRVSMGDYSGADDICQQASRRLNILKQNGKLDGLKIGMAYRRLGRQYYDKSQYDDARRILNQALRYLGTEKPPVLVEIYHLQEKMARIAEDTIDVDFWQTKLSQMDANLAHQEEDETITPVTQSGSYDESVFSDHWSSVDTDDYWWSQQPPPTFHPSGMQFSSNLDSSVYKYELDPCAVDAVTTPTIYFNQDVSGTRFTDDPEPIVQSTHGNPQVSTAQGGTVNPALTSVSTTNLWRTQSSASSGYVYELPELQQDSLIYYRS